MSRPLLQRLAGSARMKAAGSRAAQRISTPRSNTMLPAPPRSFHTLRSALLSHVPCSTSGSAGYVGLFSFPYGLASAEDLLASYRSTSDPSAAASLLHTLQRSLETESHALELDRHLEGKCASDRKVEAIYTELAGRVDILKAKLTELSDTMLMERFDKEFVIYPHPSAGSAASSSAAALPPADGIRVASHWSTHRHSVRTELAPLGYEARLTVTPFRVVQNAAGEPVSEDGASKSLIQATQGGRETLDLDLLHAIISRYGGPSMSPRQFVWFLAFMTSHPSDLAFDVVSAVMMNQLKDRS
jgi:hypothetical protein